jgi:hypothetical protein
MRTFLLVVALVAIILLQSLSGCTKVGAEKTVDVPVYVRSTGWESFKVIDIPSDSYRCYWFYASYSGTGGAMTSNLSCHPTEGAK